MYLIGQKRNLELIKNWTEMPSFLIVQGNNDMGKTYFIKYLCHKFGLGYKLFDNKVETIRNLTKNMVTDGNTVYHFKDFHNASINAKNALLKVTEEPLKGNYIAISGLKQIDTLESRARIIKMQPYTDSELEEFIEQSTLNKDILRRLLKCNFRTPSTLVKYAEVENIEDIITFAESTATDILEMSLIEIDKISTRFERTYDKGKVDESLIFIEILCNLLEMQMLKRHYIGYKDQFTRLFEAKHLLSTGTNFNRRLLLQATFEGLVFDRRQ